MGSGVLKTSVLRIRPDRNILVKAFVNKPAESAREVKDDVSAVADRSAHCEHACALCRK